MSHALRLGFCRYIPAPEDKVLGVVLERFGESFNVDVGGPFVATLSALAFEGEECRCICVSRSSQSWPTCRTVELLQALAHHLWSLQLRVGPRRLLTKLTR